MSQYLPNGNYKWNNNITLEKILECREDSKTGYIIECDLEYPKELHDLHNDYPLCPEKKLVKDEYLSLFQKKLKN